MRQKVSTQTKRELLLNLRQEYLVAGRKTKSRLLDGFVTATGYDRKYAISLLNSPPREIVIMRSRKKKYDEEVFTALRQLWTAANGICPRRLIPFLPKLLVSLERFGHMKVSSAVRTKLLAMSASTAERMLRSERQENGKGKGLTRPGSLLRKQIAIKTFAGWNDDKVGFFEIDLVAHCGGDIRGRFVNTLTMTDIATGWTEMYSLLYKNEEFVRAALDWASEDLPFKIKGIDTDNGGEFLNHGMVGWCASRQITFTRSRAYRKNDQAHVEEKNGSIVRRLVDYERLEEQRCASALADLYKVSRLYTNYFQPSMKLLSKVRDGSKVRKQYDIARTPLERLLKSRSVPRLAKEQLKMEFEQLDPMLLLETMAELQKRLWNQSTKQTTSSRTAAETKPKQLPKRAPRKRYYKRNWDSRTGKIFCAILKMKIGTKVEAKQFYKYGTIHFVNVTLQKFCERDRIIARTAWGQYTRTEPSEWSKIKQVRRKTRNRKTNKAFND